MSVKAQILFESMNHVFDELEQIREVLEVSLNDRAQELGLANEIYNVIAGVDNSLEALEDFLPGLEAEVHDTEE